MIELNDVIRVSLEFGHAFLEPDEWAERNDFRKEALYEFVEGQTLTCMMRLAEAAKEEERETITPELLEAHIRTAVLAGFLLGWEINKQLGKRDMSQIELESS